MKLTFRVLEDKPDKFGACPVFVDFAYSGRRLRFFTGEKCLLKDWDVKKQRFRRSHDGYLSANDFLENLTAKIHTVYRSFVSGGVIPSTAELRDALKPKGKKVVRTFIEEFQEFIKYKSTKIQKVSLVGFNATFGRLLRYQATTGKFFPSDYSANFHNGFVSFMLSDLRLHPNSIAKTNTHLKEFLKYLGKSGVKLADELPEFSTVEIIPDVIFLNDADLQKWRSVELEPYLSRVRDAFLFSCYTGLRYGDLRLLNPSQVRQRGNYQVIELVPKKSRSTLKAVKSVEIPLLSGAVEILEKYSGGLVSLPVISNQKMNDYLKAIGERAGIVERMKVIEYEKGFPIVRYKPKYSLITTHIARHTFATLSLVKGVPIEIIQKVLGHSDIKTTMRYAKIVDEYKNAVILGAWSG